MARLVFVSLIVLAIEGAPHAQVSQREDQFSNATGFAIDLKPGNQEDAGWEHITGAVLTIAHDEAAKTYEPEPPSYGEIIVKFRSRDSNGNDATIEVGPCHTEAVYTCAYITTIGLSNLWSGWLKSSLRPNQRLEHRDLTLVIGQANGAKRTFYLADSYPRSYTQIELSSQGGSMTMSWTLEVRVNRVEMA